MNLSQIPFKYMFDMLSRITTYACGNVERTFVYNSKSIGYIWSIVSRFIPEHSRKKI